MRRQGYLRPELGWEPPKSFPMSWKSSPSPRLLPVVQAWCLVEVKDHGADEQQDEPLHATLITVHYKGTRIPWKNPNLMKVLFSRVTVHYRPRCAVKTPKVENKKKKKKESAGLLDVSQNPCGVGHLQFCYISAGGRMLLAPNPRVF